MRRVNYDMRPGSRAITVGGVSVDDAYERILKAFTAVPQ